MDFVISWLAYLVAFALGSVLTFFVLARRIPATSEHDAFADLDEAGYDSRYDVDHHADGDHA